MEAEVSKTEMLAICLARFALAKSRYRWTLSVVKTTSAAGAVGIASDRPKWATPMLTVNVQKAIYYGRQVTYQSKTSLGDWETALAAYTGYGNVNNAMKSNGYKCLAVRPTESKTMFRDLGGRCP